MSIDPLSDFSLFAQAILAGMRDRGETLPTSVHAALKIVDRKMPDEPQEARYQLAETLYQISRRATDGR